MSKRFDATIKDLAAQAPADFVARFDGPTSLPVQLLNVDLSTVTTAADVVFGVGDPLMEILHVDAQAGPSAGKQLDIIAYNALLYRTYRVPVRSCVLLLRPQAQHPNLTGTVQYSASRGRGKMDFEYDVIRLWEMPVEDLLRGPLATIPLAVLGKLPDSLSFEQALADVVQRLAERLQQEAVDQRAKRLLTAAYILAGLRLAQPADVTRLFQGVSIAMRESVTYQAILEEGREQGREQGREEGREEGREQGRKDELHRTILRLGRERFGEADPATQRQLEALSDIDALEELCVRLLKVDSWSELLP